MTAFHKFLLCSQEIWTVIWNIIHSVFNIFLTHCHLCDGIHDITQTKQFTTQPPGRYLFHSMYFTLIPSHCVLVMLNGVIEHGHHPFRQWHFDRWHQAITWTMQCWLIISEVLWHSSGGNFSENAWDFYPWYEFEHYYHEISDISHTSAGNKIVHPLDVVGAPVFAAPTTSSFSTYTQLQ